MTGTVIRWLIFVIYLRNNPAFEKNVALPWPVTGLITPLTVPGIIYFTAPLLLSSTREVLSRAWFVFSKVATVFFRSSQGFGPPSSQAILITVPFLQYIRELLHIERKGDNNFTVWETGFVSSLKLAANLWCTSCPQNKVLAVIYSIVFMQVHHFPPTPSILKALSLQSTPRCHLGRHDPGP